MMDLYHICYKKATLKPGSILLYQNEAHVTFICKICYIYLYSTCIYLHRHVTYVSNCRYTVHSILQLLIQWYYIAHYTCFKQFIRVSKKVAAAERIQSQVYLLTAVNLKAAVRVEYTVLSRLT